MTGVHIYSIHDINIFDLGAQSLSSEQFYKFNENCWLPDFLTDCQIRHLGNPSGLPYIFLKIDIYIHIKNLRRSFH